MKNDKLQSLIAYSLGVIRNLFRKYLRKHLQAPDFIIVGPQKTGTTSLYFYLRKHPNFLPASAKEVHFFDRYYQKGTKWYKCHFATKIEKKIYQVLFRKTPIISGESTPYYFNCPHVPKRVFQHYPHIKLIFMFRNPVKRAYSHYHHEGSLEPYSFKKATSIESKRLIHEYEKLKNENFYFSAKHQHYGYLDSSKYSQHLKEWFKYFDKSQILIIISESFFKNPEKEYKRALDFLNLPHHSLPEYKKINKNKYSPISSEMEETLKNYFSPFNEELKKLIKEDFDWK